VVLAGAGQWLMSMLPEDPESTILKKLKKPRPEETETDQHGALERPDYSRSASAGMHQLLEAGKSALDDRRAEHHDRTRVL